MITSRIDLNMRASWLSSRLHTHGSPSMNGSRQDNTRWEQLGDCWTVMG